MLTLPFGLQPNPRFAAIASLCAASLMGCANLNTVARSTSLPREARGGKAVHLDIQQRLLIANDAGVLCAEPSPDALAAFAATIGLGTARTNGTTGSLTAGQQSAAASVGLRTQSITLMRDALYRMCESYANGAISPAQIAVLLGRSQDLTAVILAVEQLTGAVTANQVALTGTTSSSASAAVLANQALLDAARENEASANEKLDDAAGEVSRLSAIRDTKKNENAQAIKERDRLIAANSDATEAQVVVDSTSQALQRSQADVDAAETLRASRKASLDDARRNRETIEKIKDASLASATAGTTSESQFSTPVQRIGLSKDATEAVAKTVETLVTTVLQKQYSADACTALLTWVPRDYEKWGVSQKEYLSQLQGSCRDVVVRDLNARTSVSNFAPDDSSQRIDAWLAKDAANRPRLTAWLAQNQLDFSATTLLFGADNAAWRRRAISDLMIP